MILEFGESRQEDVIALEIDVKGQTEPFQLVLDPYAIFIPGENYIGVNVRRKFKVRLLLPLPSVLWEAALYIVGICRFPMYV